MSRIFNIYFSFNDTDHNGIVSVRKTPFFTEYTLQFEDDLMVQLPCDKLISTSTGNFFFQHASQQSSPLMEEVIKAVSNHLQALEA